MKIVIQARIIIIKINSFNQPHIS